MCSISAPISDGSDSSTDDDDEVDDDDDDDDDDEDDDDVDDDEDDSSSGRLITAPPTITTNTTTTTMSDINTNSKKSPNSNCVLGNENGHPTINGSNNIRFRRLHFPRDSGCYDATTKNSKVIW